MKPIRVAIVHHGATPGGAPVSLLHFLEAALSSGRVDPVLFTAYESMAPFFQDRLGVETRLLPDPLTGLGKTEIWGIPPLMRETRRAARAWRKALPASIRAQTGALRDARPELVHLSSSVLVSTAAAAAAANLPVVWQIRETFHGRVGGSRARRMRARMHSAAALLVPTWNEARSFGLAEHPRMHVHRHPVNLSSFNSKHYSKEEARRHLGLPLNIPIVLSTGGVSHWKGSVECLEALQFLPPETRLVFLGPRPAANPTVGLRNRLAWAAEDLLVSLGGQDHALFNYAERTARTLARVPPDRVLFAGHQTDPVPWFSAADVVVYAATGAHYPRGIFDAWALRRPVVSTRVGGVLDCVEEGVDALLAPPRDPAALAAALTTLLQDPARSEQMAEAGCQKTRRDCDPARIADAILDLYDSILSPGGVPTAAPGTA